MLATALIESLRRRSILLPPIGVIERICAGAITRATRQIHRTLTDPLSAAHREKLDTLLTFKPGAKVTLLAWLRQPSRAAKATHVLTARKKSQPRDAEEHHVTFTRLSTNSVSTAGHRKS